MFEQLPAWAWYAAIGGAILLFLYRQQRWPFDRPPGAAVTPLRSLSLALPAPAETTPIKINVPCLFQLVPVNDPTTAK